MSEKEKILSAIKLIVERYDRAEKVAFDEEKYSCFSECGELSELRDILSENGIETKLGPMPKNNYCWIK